MNNCKLLFSFMAGLVLVGCDSKIDAVNQKMAEIRNEPTYLLSQHQYLVPYHYLTIQHIN